MIDGYNRNINYLRISITDRCNLRCSYCMPKEGVSALGHEDVLRYEEILRIVKVAVSLGITKVRITGGEPLVRRGVVNFIASLAQISGLTDISLTTNGILLAPFAVPLFNAGMKRINISLDSLNEAKYARITRGGELHAVLRGIEAVHQAGFYPVKINTVVIKGVNDDEIVDFARLTLHKPYQIRFIELMPMGQAGLDCKDQYLSNDVILERINRVYQLEPCGDEKNTTHGPARMYKIEGGLGEIGFISPISHHFCESCNRLRLTADGHLRACLLQDKDVDLRDALRNGCKEGDLRGLMSGVIAAKPGRHELSYEEHHVKKCAKEMSAIGG
jgi:cyclic pyranopterin phosphate synthase